MARIISPIVPPNDPRQCAPWLNTVLRRLNDLTFQSQRGLAAVARGELPDGSGTPLFDDTKYLYLPGRIGGQTVLQVDSNPAVTIKGTASTLSVVGTFGNPIFRIKDGETVLADFRPYLFAASTVELAITDENGDGIAVNFPSNDGTSAFRIASTTNRTYLQCGLKNSVGGVDNPNMTIGGAGATLATSLAYEFSRINISNSAGTERSTRVGFNINVDEFSGSSISDKAGSVHIAGNNDVASLGSPAADAAPAPLILERGSVANTTAARNLLEVRGDSSAGSGSPITNRTLGAIRFALDGEGHIKLYNSGTYITRIRAGGSTTGTFTVEDTAGNNVLQLVTANTFADSISSQVVRLGVTTANVLIAGGGTNILARLGVIATSIVIGPASAAVLPQPIGSRIITLVNSSGVVLSGFDSAGAHFHVSGAGANKVWTSDANGVGSWQAASGGADPTANESITGQWDFDAQTDFDAQVRFNPARGMASGTTVIEIHSTNGATGNALAIYNNDPVEGLAFYITPRGVPTCDGSDDNGSSIILGNGTNLAQFMIASGTPNYIFGAIYDVDDFSLGAPNSGLYIATDGALGTFNTLTFPAAGGVVVTTLAVQTLQAKTLANACRIRTGSTVTGVIFQDTTTTTKQFRFDASLIPASTTRRVYINDKVDGVAVVRLKEEVLTGQTASIGATTLVATAATTPGMYQVDIYVRTTTAGTGGNTLAVNLLWTHGNAQNQQVIAAHDLDNNDATGDGIVGLSRYSTVVYADTSTNIQYSTTLTAASGTPAYTIIIVVRAI